jgi:2-polyprenyl-3-methyl-5-hydroxy-6-metoxy-1,4-benzoquinol methylase
VDARSTWAAAQAAIRCRSPLRSLGFSVTGVDRTAFLLDEARRHALTEGVEVEWVQEDMRSFARPNAYDLAVSVYTSFGYFDDPADNRLVLRNLFTSLKSGGKPDRPDGPRTAGPQVRTKRLP